MTVVKIKPPVPLDRGTQTVLRNLRKLRAQKDELELKIKASERKIKDAMGDHEEATVGGRPVVTWKRSIRQSLSQTLLKKSYPDAVLECTVQTEVRTFKLVEDA